MHKQNNEDKLGKLQVLKSKNDSPLQVGISVKDQQLGWRENLAKPKPSH